MNLSINPSGYIKIVEQTGFFSFGEANSIVERKLWMDINYIEILQEESLQ